jgi:hypothetical protein
MEGWGILIFKRRDAEVAERELRWAGRRKSRMGWRVEAVPAMAGPLRWDGQRQDGAANFFGY